MAECLDHAVRLLEQVNRSERALSGLGTEPRERRAVLRPSEPFLPPGGTLSREEAPTDGGRDMVNLLEEAVDGRPWESLAGETAVREIVNPAAEFREDAGTPPPSPRPEAEPVGQPDGPREEDVNRDDGGAVPAAQLERLDRAAAVFAGGTPWGGAAAGGRDGSPVSPAGLRSGALRLRREGGPGEETSSPGSPDVRPLSGGGSDWVEQADRVFRRDSRRYDGGFYLY